MRRRAVLAVATGVMLPSRPPLARQYRGLPPAEPDDLDLLLVLAVDASSSIDVHEARLQRDGYCAAVRDPVVLAILGGTVGAIGVAYVEWGSNLEQWEILPWTRIASQASADHWAVRLAQAPHGMGHLTSISGDIEFSRRLLGEAPWSASRRVIDVSGDDANNSGPPAERARDRAVSEGITINGLPIVGHGAVAGPGGTDPLAGRLDSNLTSPDWRLEEYYRTCVVGGPNAFVVVAEDFGSFAQAIRRKLIREIAGLPAAGFA